MLALATEVTGGSNESSFREVMALEVPVGWAEEDMRPGNGGKVEAVAGSLLSPGLAWEGGSFTDVRS